MMALLAALPQQADHLDSLLEHLQAHVGLGPAVAQDVLVERLAAADAEPEAPLVHDRASRGGLRDDGRVDAHGGAGDAGGDRQLGDLSERPDDRPHERAVPLLVVPRVVVVGDPQRMEARLFGAPRLVDELTRPELLTRQEAPDPHRR